MRDDRFTIIRDFKVINTYDTYRFPADGRLVRSPRINCLPSILYNRKHIVIENVQKVERKIFDRLKNEPRPQG